MHASKWATAVWRWEVESFARLDRTSLVAPALHVCGWSCMYSTWLQGKAAQGVAELSPVEEQLNVGCSLPATARLQGISSIFVPLVQVRYCTLP
jgi:hypothetical protein